jgi:hypothetical protein
MSPMPIAAGREPHLKTGPEPLQRISAAFFDAASLSWHASTVSGDER